MACSLAAAQAEAQQLRQRLAAADASAAEARSAADVATQAAAEAAAVPDFGAAKDEEAAAALAEVRGLTRPPDVWSKGLDRSATAGRCDMYAAIVQNCCGNCIFAVLARTIGETAGHVSHVSWSPTCRRQSQLAIRWQR